MKNTMNTRISFSGGGFKIPFLAGVACGILDSNKYEFKEVFGISSGALVSVPFSLNLREELEVFTRTFTEDQVFDPPLISFGSIFRALTAKSGLSTHAPLLDLYRSVVTPKKWEALKAPGAPNIYVGVTNGKTEKFELRHLNLMGWQEGTKAVVASCCIRPFVSPIKVNGVDYFDGGEYHHNAGHLHSEKLDLLVSVYARPEMPTQPTLRNTVYGNTVQVITNLIRANSKKDAKLEEFTSSLHKFKLKQIFAPHDVTIGWYEHDIESFDLLFKNGYNKGFKI